MSQVFMPGGLQIQDFGILQLTNVAGRASSASCIRYWSTTTTNTLTSHVTYTSSSVNGDSFTIINPGLYSIMYCDYLTAEASCFGISVNSNQLGTGIFSITDSTVCGMNGSDGNTPNGPTIVRWFNAGDVVRCHFSGSATGTGNPTRCHFVMVRLA